MTTQTKKLTRRLAVAGALALTLAAHVAAANEVSLQAQKITGDSNGPTVSFVATDSNQETVRIDFVAADDAHVDPNTLRVRLGLFRLDVTKKFLEYGELNGQGISIDRNLLPPGKYNVSVEVQDTLDRKTTVKMRLLVTKT